MFSVYCIDHLFLESWLHTYFRKHYFRKLIPYRKNFWTRNIFCLIYCLHTIIWMLYLYYVYLLLYLYYIIFFIYLLCLSVLYMDAFIKCPCFTISYSSVWQKSRSLIKPSMVKIWRNRNSEFCCWDIKLCIVVWWCKAENVYTTT